MTPARNRLCLIADPPRRVSDAEFARLYRMAEPEIVAVLLGVSRPAIAARAMRQGLRRGRWRARWKAWPTQAYCRRVGYQRRFAERLEALRSGVQTMELRVGAMLAGVGR